MREGIEGAMAANCSKCQSQNLVYTVQLDDSSIWVTVECRDCSVSERFWPILLPEVAGRMLALQEAEEGLDLQGRLAEVMTQYVLARITPFKLSLMLSELARRSTSMEELRRTLGIGDGENVFEWLKSIEGASKRDFILTYLLVVHDE